MRLLIVAFGISLLALVGAGSIVARHWKALALLDPNSIKEEQERQKREWLIRQRFDRFRVNQWQPIQRLGRNVWRSIAQSYARLEERLRSLESLYHQAKRPFASVAPSTRERLATLLAEARSLARDLKWAEAERRFLEMLSLDARSSDAYKGLGTIYLKQHFFDQARETYQFLLKIKRQDDTTYAGLAEIEEQEGNLAKAEQMRLKAVEMSPRQPQRHAELATLYLARGEGAKAWPSAKRASDLEPTSAKYLELSLEAAILLDDLKEARSRLDRLRLLTEDRLRYQSWREKVEQLTMRAASKNTVTPT